MENILNAIYLGYLLNVASFILFYVMIAIIMKKMKPNEMLNFVKYLDQLSEEKKEKEFMPSLLLYIIPFWGFYKLFVFILLNIRYLNNSSDAIFYILKNDSKLLKEYEDLKLSMNSKRAGTP